MARSLGFPLRVLVPSQQMPEAVKIDMSEFGPRGEVNAVKRVASRGKMYIIHVRHRILSPSSNKHFYSLELRTLVHPIPFITYTSDYLPQHAIMHLSLNTFEQTNSWVLSQALRPEDGNMVSTKLVSACINPSLISNVKFQIQKKQVNLSYLNRLVSPSSDTDSNTSLDADSIFESDDNKSISSVDSFNPYDDISYDSDGDSESADDDGYVEKCDQCTTCRARHMRALQRSIAARGFVIQSLAPVVNNITTTITTTITDHGGNVPGKGPLADVGERYTEGGSTSYSAADGQRLYTAKPPSVDEGALPGVLSQDRDLTK